MDTLFAHLPKINLGLGVVVLICFFLPWVSIDCGNVAFLKLSGYQLATGKISLDESVLAQLKQQVGDVQETDAAEQQARPQFYLLAVAACAAGMIIYGVKMLSGVNRLNALAAAAFSVLGILVMLAASAFDYGLDIPPDAAMLIQTSHQFGFYMTVICFIGAGALSLLSLRAVAGQSDSLARIDFPAAPLQANTAVPPEPLTPAAPQEDPFGEAPETAPTSKPQAGTRKCPSCGSPVGPFQTKCLKCGTKIKTGN